MEEAIRIAHKIKARVLLDPAPAIARLPKSLYRVEMILPNQFEAESILGTPVADVRSAKAAARQLRVRGAEVAVVKLGEQGVVWATHRGIFYLPGESVTAIDAVGAGDAFAGALAARLDAGDALADAIRLANHAAALSTTKSGAQPSFPLWQEVRQG